MTESNAESSTDSPSTYVTYVVVVHGIGEQRKNECVINVVNRFAEARRDAKEDDNRDVLTLGKASGQTGPSKVPGPGQPWIEFEGIPNAPSGDDTLPPFLGERAESGENLRFVDLCWSDVMQDSVKHVGQDADLWAKGLLGRLLRKHSAAKKDGEKVPFWVRRILYLLADTLLLVRFAMNFRFKEMKDLVFVKFLGDVQLYGEYSRCRGRAVRRFHETMAKVEAAHYAGEADRSGPPREPGYVIIAHSLGSIMSLDALLYASATSLVRRGSVPVWKFPGYLRDDDQKCESREEGRFALIDTCWIQRLRSFVTLGSPIDKYLTIWWMNYRYLLECDGYLPRRERPIAHFNYCDELDPVGHKLDVVQATPAYEAVFRCEEDVVFNRYSVPGAAHNKYWTDQRLFGWILHRAVDLGSGMAGEPPKRLRLFGLRVYSKLLRLIRWTPGPVSAKYEAPKPAERPRWFRRKAYVMLLLWLYILTPLLILLGVYASLSLAFQADGWRTAAIAAAMSSFLTYSGRHLIDLSIWWRQIQRHESGSRCDDPQRSTRRRWAWLFRAVVAVVPFVWATLTTVALVVLTVRTDAQGDAKADSLVLCCASSPEDPLTRPLLVGAVVAAIGGLLACHRLPAAYRAPAFEGRRFWPKAEQTLLVAAYIATLVTLAYIGTKAAAGPGHDRFFFDWAQAPSTWVDQLAFVGVVATAVYAYRLYRFLAVKYMLRRGQPQKITFEDYAGGASCVDDA